MSHPITDIDLIYKLFSPEEIMERAIFKTFGLKGGVLEIDSDYRIDVDVINSEMEPQLKLKVPFETAINFDKIGIFTIDNKIIKFVIDSKNAKKLVKG